MPTIPPALLSRLYVKQSLCNTENGFEFGLYNHLAPSTLTGVGPLHVDGHELGKEHLQVRIERPVGKRGRQPEPLVRHASTIEPGKAVRFDLDTTLRVVINDRWLAPGDHHCTLVLTTREVGTLVVEVADSVVEHRSSSG